RTETGAWEPTFFTGSEILDLIARDDRILGVGPFAVYVWKPGEYFLDLDLRGAENHRAFTEGPGGTLWVGDFRRGLLEVPPLPEADGPVAVDPVQVVMPSGPALNTPFDVDVGDDGTLWVGFEASRGFAALSRLTPVGAWTSFESLDPSLDIARTTFLTVTAGPDGTCYAASFGDGLTVVPPAGPPFTYRSNNSTLQSVVGTNNFIVIGQALPDAQGQLWVTNRGAANPLHVRLADGTWHALPYPPGLPTTVYLDQLVFDEFGQLWSNTPSRTGPNGQGLAVVNTGADPISPADDRALHIGGAGTNGVGLPNEEVNVVAYDLDGILWIGTERGLASIASPGSAFGGDPALVQPVWARTPDGTSYFLRDLWINDIAVDPAGQKWIASTAGAWLINAEGDTALRTFTAENSPLFSDNVLAVDVDPTTGRVYFATDRGLLSFDAEAIQPAPQAGDLHVAPSPFRPVEHPNGVLITGLVAETTIRILTPDGQVVAALDARGGSVRWDGRDTRTGEVVGSGVYLVAASGVNGEGTAYGKIAVLR
ncbi:MAG TPA: hypothetical protein VD962_01375, partial [Rubricoccaceae bacterium]|nr:hypothetical protein [Rubricoccaceae bacterium]